METPTAPAYALLLIEEVALGIQFDGQNYQGNDGQNRQKQTNEAVSDTTRRSTMKAGLNRKPRPAVNQPAPDTNARLRSFRNAFRSARSLLRSLPPCRRKMQQLLYRQVSAAIGKGDNHVMDFLLPDSVEQVGARVSG